MMKKILILILTYCICMQTSTANEDIIEGVRLARDNTDFAVVISYTVSA